MASYQVVQRQIYRQIEKLTEEGRFKGNQAARTVLVYFAMNTSVVDDLDRGLAKGYVMEGCISTAAIMGKTGLSSASVNRAVRWLQDEGLIKVEYLTHGKRQEFGSIQVTLQPHLSLVHSKSS